MSRKKVRCRRCASQSLEREVTRCARTCRRCGLEEADLTRFSHPIRLGKRAWVIRRRWERENASRGEA